MNLRRTIRGPITWLIVAVILVLALVTITSNNGGYKSVALSKIEQAIAAHEVSSATIKDKEQQIQVTLADNKQIEGSNKLESNYSLHYDDALQQEISDAGVPEKKVTVFHENAFLTILYSLIPFALILLIMFFFLNQMQGGGGRVMQFGKARAKLV